MTSRCQLLFRQVFCGLLALAAIIAGAAGPAVARVSTHAPYVYDAASNTPAMTSGVAVAGTATRAPNRAHGAASAVELSAAQAGFVAAETAGDGTAVIGKVKDLGSVGDNEYTLLDRLPDQGSPKANWKQNSGVLRQVMSRGTPIRDASVDPATGALNPYPGSFLNAERNLLQTKGWTYDPKTTLWSPGG